MSTRIGERGSSTLPACPRAESSNGTRSGFPRSSDNNPFYRLPEPATVERWRDAVPPTFLFAFKASRFITHTLRLRDSAPRWRS